jgi:hypothetical protein
MHPVVFMYNLLLLFRQNTKTIIVHIYFCTTCFGSPEPSSGTHITLDLRETGWDGMDRINQAQDRDQWRALVNTVMNLRVT